MASLLPKTLIPRPPLPSKMNRHLNDVDSRPIVKYQRITKDEGLVIVGRVRVNTPSPEQNSGHAYILRRYDTGYISATTMFRAAFPNAKSSEEKEEQAWIKANFDLRPSTPEAMRLAGTWVSPELAHYLAPSYNLKNVITALADSEPDAGYIAEANKKEGSDTRYPTTPSGPNKRRKESHDLSSTNGTNGHLSTPSKTPQSTSKKPASASKTRESPGPSRSTPSRTVKSRKAASPSPASQAPVAATTPGRTSRRSALPKTIEAEEEEEEAKPPLVDAVEDIAESQALVQRLKAEKEAEMASTSTVTKRTREEADAPLTLSLDGQAKDAVPVEERALVTNRRVVPTWPTLQPQQKAVAWGTLAFALGWGATTYLPTLLPQFF